MTPKPTIPEKIWREIKRPFRQLADRVTASIDAKLGTILNTLEQQRQEIIAMKDDFNNKFDQQQEIATIPESFKLYLGKKQIITEHLEKWYPKDAVEFFKRINYCQNSNFSRRNRLTEAKK